MHAFDNALFLWLNATAASPAWLVPLARLVSVDLPQWLVAGLLGALIVGDAGMRRLVLRVLLAMAIAWILARVGQRFFHASRPFVLGLGRLWLPHGDSPGFPSTHATVAFAFAFAIMASVRGAAHATLARAAALAAACAIGWSRICLGLHFPSDILVGVVVGAVGAWMGGYVPTLLPRLRAAHE